LLYLPGRGVYGVRYLKLFLHLLKSNILSFEASVNFLDGTKIEQQRILLAVYPLLWVLFVNPAFQTTYIISFQAFLFRSGVDDTDPVNLGPGVCHRGIILL
jgi:hypothetical protein